MSRWLQMKTRSHVNNIYLKNSTRTKEISEIERMKCNEGMQRWGIMTGVCVLVISY